VRSVVSQIVPDCDILIVDNASTDNTPQLAAGFAATYPQVTVLREPELGLSVARNLALTKARGEYVVFLDDDAEAEPGWLEAYRSFFLRPPSPNIACVGGAVLPNHEVAPPTWLKSDSFPLNWSQLTQPFRGGAGPWGCNFALQRKVGLEQGGFSSGLGRKGKGLGAHEESEISNRLKQAGYAVWWLPTARIRHFVPAERLRLGWQLRSQFNQGRSSAVMRLRNANGLWLKWRYLIGRLLLAPFHLSLNVLLVLVSYPFRGGQVAAHALLRSARILGFARQLLAEAIQSSLGR
jgi:glycosyltransferase involved in cell wall biosynthesis